MSPFVNEYIERQRLKKIGITSSYEELPYIKSMIFAMIGVKIEDIQDKEMKKARSK